MGVAEVYPVDVVLAPDRLEEMEDLDVSCLKNAVGVVVVVVLLGFEKGNGSAIKEVICGRESLESNGRIRGRWCEDPSYPFWLGPM